MRATIFDFAYLPMWLGLLVGALAYHAAMLMVGQKSLYDVLRSLFSGFDEFVLRLAFAGTLLSGVFGVLDMLR